MKANDLPTEFLEKLRAVTARRAKTVIDHILEHGYITTEQLKDTYGYNHPPRAIKDVTDLGIPIKKTMTTGKDGRRMASYTFGDPSAVRGATHAGRAAFPKLFKKALIERYGCRCALCSAEFQPGDLQIDHRVPYEVGGDPPGDLNADDYMLVCQTCNRAKSWACEHCQNWRKDKNPDVCETCFWGNPDSYTHIALRLIRRLNLVWSEGEVAEHDKLAAQSKDADVELPEYVKGILKKHLEA